MSPKKQKKKGETRTEKEYTLLSLEEMKIRELKHAHRLMELSKCVSFIDDAVLKLSNLNEEQLLQDKWLDFVNCNPLPKPYIPPDIRLYYSKLKYWENDRKANTINWLLSVNERSLLTQDICRQDMTRSKLNLHLKQNIGQEYNNYIKDSLSVLRRIENFLDNDVELAKCPLNILNDIVTRKWAVQEEIMDLLDRYTYRIISLEEAQMNSIDAICSEYCYKADNFRIHIWSIKNVALRIPYLSEPRLLANFHSIKLLLHVPQKMLRENLCIRALHMDFDLLSKTAKSFKQNLTLSVENINAGIVDLPECLANEWLMQLEVQDRTRTEMIQLRMEYEEKLRQYEGQMEKKKARNKEGKGSKMKGNVTKPTKEPPLVANDMFPDTYDQFLEEEQKQYEHFIQTVYKPELLNLTPDEINLKKYFILGGIYQLYYVQKPIHYDFNCFNMTWHHNQGQLVVDKNVSISSSFGSKYFESNLSTHSQEETSKRLTKRMTIFEADNLNTTTDVECPWFIVTIQLPEYLCYWGQPIACQFETTAERNPVKVEDLQIETTDIVKTKNNSKKIKIEQEPLTLAKPPQPAINPATENTRESHATDSLILKTQCLSDSQKMAHASFFKSSLSHFLRQSNRYDQTIKDSTSALCINDFPLTSNNLTKFQIRHLERHIVPRIISSYKFPKEIRQEEIELYNKKPKGKGGKIIRQKAENFEHKLSNRQFTFTGLQNKPERIFATYPKVLPLNIVTHLADANLNDDQEEPETFAQLLQIISNIKKKYRLRVRQTLDLKPFETEIKTHNKRIKQMQRKRKPSIKDSSINTSRSTIVTRRTTKHLINKSLKDDRKSKQILMDKEILEANKLVEAEESKTDYSVEENLLLNAASSDVAISKETKQEKTDPTSSIYSHWTTKYILKSDYVRETHKITLHTNRLGNFGFAFKRYEHFPFKYWNMEPSATDPENEVIFTLDTQYVRCVLNITANGIRGHVTEPTKTYLRNPKMYLIIEKPLKDYQEFKKLFKEKHLNIFAEHDASFYIENGYFSEKHLSNEMHTYCCMAVHSTQMRFNFSQWNRLAKRRDIILHFQQYKDLADNLVEVRLTPGEAFFVEIQELCSEDLNVTKLDYNLTWRNIESYSDLHHLIVAMYPAAFDLRCQNPQLICYIRDILSEIRPLSFS